MVLGIYRVNIVLVEIGTTDKKMQANIWCVWVGV